MINKCDFVSENVLQYEDEVTITTNENKNNFVFVFAYEF